MPTDSTTFVLVHGAWGGGWHWRRVADRLRSRGHSVFTPTLTGLGERAHQLHPGVDLSLHIADVLGVIKYESLNDIVLVGHSYGGFVISGVTEVIPRKIRSIVFLDAFVPDDSEALVDIVQPAVQEIIRGAQARGETTVPVRDAAAFRMNEKDRAWATRSPTRSRSARFSKRSRSPARAIALRRKPTSAPWAIRTYRSTSSMNARKPIRPGALTK